MLPTAPMLSNLPILGNVARCARFLMPVLPTQLLCIPKQQISHITA